MIKRIISSKYIKDLRFILGTTILVLFVLAAIFAPVFAPYDPLETNYSHTFSNPDGKFLLGSDEYGRDILSRLIYGARISLFVSLCSLIVSMVGGTFLGLVAATSGKMIDNVIMRIVDMIFCIPPIFVAIALVAFLGGGISNLTLIMGIIYMPHFARIAYTSSLKVKNKEYIEAEKALGGSKLRIIFKHILPNILSPIIIQASFSLGALILLEAGMSFLGLGIMPPTPSWGVMLSTGKSYLYNAPHLLLVPAIAIAIIVLTINILGDSLRDLLDPKL